MSETIAVRSGESFDLHTIEAYLREQIAGLGDRKSTRLNSSHIL